MSQENVETLRRLYNEWSRGAFWRLGGLLAPGATFWSELPPGQVLCHGRREIDSFFREFLRQWRDYRIEGDEFIELNDQSVLVVGRQSGQGTHSGATTEQPLLIVWTFRGGTVTGMYCAIERGTALEAAGLPE
jgi:ketosteroid isomerase-like protein